MYGKGEEKVVHWKIHRVQILILRICILDIERCLAFRYDITLLISCLLVFLPTSPTLHIYTYNLFIPLVS